MHKFKMNQTVMPVRSSRDRPEVYEITRLMPELPNGEAQYRIKSWETGTERIVREVEIKPFSEIRPFSA